MKRFLSLLLCLTLVFGAMAVTAVSVSAEKKDLAETGLSAPDYELVNAERGVNVVIYDDQEYVTKYIISRSDANQNKFSIIAQVATDGSYRNEYLDRNVVSGKAYKYKVAAYDGSSGPAVQKKITYLSKPRLTAKVDYNGKLSLSWSKATGAKKYQISITTLAERYLAYDVREDDNPYYDNRTTTATSFLYDPNSFAGEIFGYEHPEFNISVWAVAADNSESEHADADLPYSAIPRFRVTALPNGYRVTTISDNCDVFYTCAAWNYKWKKYAYRETAGNTDFTKLQPGTSYRFTCRKKYEGVYCSGFKSSGDYAYYPAPKVTKWKKLANGAMQLTWQKGIGAAKYRVFGWNGTKWVALGDTTKLTGNVRCFKTGTNPIYAIRSINSKGKFISWYWENILILKNGSIRYYYPPTWAR